MSTLLSQELPGASAHVEEEEAVVPPPSSPPLAKLCFQSGQTMGEVTDDKDGLGI